MKILVSELVERFHLELVGPDNVVEHFGLCNRKSLFPNTISFVANSDYLDEALQNENVCAIICKPQLKPAIDKKGLSILLSEHPEDTFYAIFNYMSDSQEGKKQKPHYGKNCKIHSSAIIEDGVEIGDNVIISAFTFIHTNTVVGNNTIISSHSAISTTGFQALNYYSGKR